MQKSTAVVGMLIAGALGFFLGTLTKGGGLTGGAADGSAAVGAADGAGGARGVVDPNTNVFNVPIGKAFCKGPADAKVTIIEFSDFQCPFCSRVNPTIDTIMKENTDVRVCFKHNALPMHPDAPLASAAAIAAGNQGKFWEFHDKLFANQKAIKRDNLIAYATELGLDMAKFTADMDGPATKAIVAEDMKLANAIGARGTPNFFINGVNLRGAQPVEKFREAIAEARGRADALLAKGVAAGALYAEIIKNGRTSPAEAAARPGAPDPNAVYKVPTDGSPKKGGAAPKVTIIEWSDFQCPFCSRVNPTMKTIMDTYGDAVAIHFRHMPLPMHPDAPLAAEASLAANAQGKFWPMHDLLFANQKALKREDLIRYAGEIGLNVATFTADLDSGKYKAAVAKDMAVGKTFGVTGTPKFFVNGRVIGGAVPFESFKKVIDEEIAKADKLIAAGTPATALYAKLTERGLANAAAPAPAAPAGGRPTVDPKAIHKVSIPAGRPIKGAADALVTIVEFSDFQCPFCGKVNPTMDQILKAYPGKVRITFLNNALPFHKDAHLAAEAALAANEQGKFWEYHDKLFANQKALGRADLERYATELGLNLGKFKAALDSGTFKAAVDADMALAAKVGARGTPAFFINGRFVSGARPFEAFKPVIDEEIKRAEALLAKGTPKNKLYEALIAGGSETAVMITPPAAPGAPGAAPGRPAVDTTVYTVPVGDSFFKGPKNAPVTIVEFSDFQCPFCSRVNPPIAKLMETHKGKIRVAFKHFPLAFHADAPLAAEASIIAGKMGKFWEMHDKLFANQKALKRDDLIRYAGELGLNTAKFTADLDSRKYKAAVAADMALATKVGVTGTPTSFVNGRKVVGANEAALDAAVTAALAGK